MDRKTQRIFAPIVFSEAQKLSKTGKIPNEYRNPELVLVEVYYRFGDDLTLKGWIKNLHDLVVHRQRSRARNEHRRKQQNQGANEHPKLFGCGMLF